MRLCVSSLLWNWGWRAALATVPLGLLAVWVGSCFVTVSVYTTNTASGLPTLAAEEGSWLVRVASGHVAVEEIRGAPGTRELAEAAIAMSEWSLAQVRAEYRELVAERERVPSVDWGAALSEGRRDNVGSSERKVEAFTRAVEHTRMKYADVVSPVPWRWVWRSNWTGLQSPFAGLRLEPARVLVGARVQRPGLGWVTVVPLLLPMAASWVLAVPLGRNVWRVLRGKRRRARGQCEGCGYDLRGLVGRPVGEGRCPECGRGV